MKPSKMQCSFGILTLNKGYKYDILLSFIDDEEEIEFDKERLFKNKFNYFISRTTFNSLFEAEYYSQITSLTLKDLFLTNESMALLNAICEKFPCPEDVKNAQRKTAVDKSSSSLNEIVVPDKNLN